MAVFKTDIITGSNTALSPVFFSYLSWKKNRRSLSGVKLSLYVCSGIFFISTTHGASVRVSL